VKILAESGLPLTLRVVLEASDSAAANREQVAAFLGERLHFYLKDVRGFAYDVVSAVLAAGADDVRDAIARAEALTEAGLRRTLPRFRRPSSASRTFCGRPRRRDLRWARRRM